MQAESKHTVLVVDDDEGILKALKRLLANLEVDVFTAGSGQEALNLLKNQPVSLIISDQRMPKMTGVEFLQRSREISPDSIRVLLTGYADIDATVDAINKGAIKYYFNKPWDDEFLLSRLRESLEMYKVTSENKRLTKLTRRQNQQLKELNASLEQKVEEQTTEIKTQHHELVQSFMETIRAFSTIIELRFEEVGSHSQRVATLVKRLLENLNLGRKEYQDTFIAAFLHDIGKVSLPDRIIAKALDHYTNADTETLARHPILGQSCVYNITGFEEIGIIVRHHHENYDGSGYPDGLREHRIPLGSRIIRIADSFDHHAFTKGYPDMKTSNDAAAHLVRHSGAKFDPDLVKRFIDCDIARDFLVGDSSEARVVRPAELQEGMVVAEDISTKHGMFLLPKGAKLSEGMIKRIVKIHEADPILNGVKVYGKKEKKTGESRYVSVQDIVG